MGIPPPPCSSQIHPHWVFFHTETPPPPQLWAMGTPAGHFTHVFIDEAGHAEEPLTLSAIAGFMAPPQGRDKVQPLLILAGGSDEQ